MTNDKDILLMIVSVTAVLLIMVIFIVSFLLIYKNRQLKHQAELASVQEKFNQEILKTQLEIKEQTLKNISEEIHDNVGQVLSLAVLSLSALELHDPDKAAIKIEHITRHVEKAVSDLRNLSKTLDAENIAQMGLATVVRFEMELVEKTGLYHTSFNILGEEQRLNPDKEIILYRIIQESLNNIIKHAGATHIRITLNFGYSHLDIEITDDGRGFDLAKNTEGDMYKKGAGIKNMSRRARLIGASFDIQSAAGGTTVFLNIPYSEN
ncbi:MAG: sensor histidine kinase [Chitinophagaceae bacterium]